MQPQYNAFVKDYRQRYVPSTKTRDGEGSSQDPHQQEQQQEVLLAYDDQSGSQVIQIDASQYYAQPSRVIVSNVQNFS